MKYRRWSILALLLCLMVLVVPASAQGNVVIDVDSAQSIDRSRLQTAAKQLTSKGRNVVVVVADRGGSGDGLAYLDGRLKTLGVATSHTSLPANTLVYYVSFEPRVSGIFYSTSLRPALDDNAIEKLRANYLNAGLRNNNPTGGLVDVMTQTAVVLADPVTARTESTSGVGSGLIWLIGAIGIGGLAFFVVPSFLKRRSGVASAAEALEQTRNRFVAAKRAAGAAISDLAIQMNDATEKQRFDKVSYPTTQVQDLEKRHRAVQAQFNQLQVQFDDIGERIDPNPAPSVTDLEGATGAYDGVRTQIQHISQALHEMDALRKEFDAINAQAPAEVDRVKKP